MSRRPTTIAPPPATGLLLVMLGSLAVLAGWADRPVRAAGGQLEISVVDRNTRNHRKARDSWQDLLWQANAE